MYDLLNFCEPEFFLIQKLKSYTKISVSRDKIKIFWFNKNRNTVFQIPVA